MALRLIDAERFLRVLGEELRAARKRHGLIRRDIIPQLDRPVSEPTLGTYELGTRDAPITRIVEFCMAMGESPVEVIRRAWEQTRIAGFNLDLAAVAQLRDADLAPLVAWAVVHLKARDGRRIVYLSRAAIAPLAVLCKLEWLDLVHRLPRSKPAE
jgi:hypothetical protein